MSVEKRPPCRSAVYRKQIGFTLIELLTVIAIIGILAAILIPVVGKVRDSAKNSVCQSNLREWHNAWLMYANDHNGQVPRAQQRGADGRTAGWVELLAHYADYDLREDPFWFDHRDDPHVDTIGNCPSDPNLHGHGENYISYAMNVEVFGVDFTDAAPGESSQTNIDTLGEFPNLIVIGERARNWHMNRTSIRDYEDETFRHNNRANYVTVGGAVYAASKNDKDDPPIRMWDPNDPAGY